MRSIYSVGLLAFLLTSAVFIPSKGFAQLDDERPSQIWAPWNSHENLARVSATAPSEPSLELQSSVTNIPITTSAAIHTECSIAINPLDSLNMVMEEIDFDKYYSNGVFVTHDGGISWSEASLPIEQPGFSSFGDPWVSFDAKGVAYVVGLQRNAAGKLRLQLHRSSDKGDSWQFDSNPFDNGSVDTTADEPVIVFDRDPTSPYCNSLYVMSASDASGLLGTTPVGVRLQYRRQGGSSFSNQIRTSNIALAQVPHITVGLHGELFIAYIGVTDILTLAGGLYLNRSTDGGATWSKDQIIQKAQYTDTINGFPTQGFPAASRMGPTPRIQVDTSNGPRRGWLYVSYALPASSDHRGNLDIYCQHSSDDGVTWNKPVRVNDDPLASLNDQLTPCMAINPDGTIGIVFYDRRDDPNNLLIHAYFAISTDGGETFVNIRVSSAATDPRSAGIRCSMPLADYISIGATRSAFFPVWTDGRYNNGDLQIYTARVPIATSGVSGTRQPTSLRFSTYPNPFQSSTLFRFSAPEGTPTRITVYDVLGREVARIEEGFTTGAEQLVRFDASLLPTGSYVARLISGDQVMDARLIHIRP